jgi:hypothetical protein
LCPSSRAAFLAATWLASARAIAGGEAVLEVGGAIVATSPRLEVRVVVQNHGDRPAAPLDVVGELAGERREARLADGVPAGGSATALLDFPPPRLRPGVHALTLLLEHPVEGAPDAASNPPVASQRAWLLLAIGASAEPAVTLAPEPLRLDVRGRLVVVVESADGREHRVRLRVLTARGLRSEGEGEDLTLPARGAVRASFPLVRAGAARGTRHAVLVVAESLDGPLARTTVATAAVEVAPDPSLLPRIRTPLAILGLVLLATALGAEVWLRARDRRPPDPPAGPATA